ncbi:helix-turn-helix domain-containing protein [Fibrella sp. HMF5335]|uniref:Helix-turn-helix domain-containing protein n=1 Tax=Fibrella rubiginis TaxID=2817060 RepID=A0A939GH66_9BACT|nr:helix-turn-helix domain-containing protein [Fibrella rubiginis]MBO0938266.1 helix-turn-helix domain-containing protein [Fibrella rubiginis]
MKASLQNYDGLYGDHYPAILPDFVHIERIEARSLQHKWLIKPHIHAQLFQLFCIETGSGTLYTERGDLLFTSPCLLQIPDNTLHGFNYSANTTGMVLTLSSAFVQQVVSSLPFLDSGHNDLHIIALQTNKTWFTYLKMILIRLSDEATDNLPGRSTVINSLLTALLTDLFRYVNGHHTVDTTNRNRSLTLFQQFQQSIRRSRNPQKNISQYADEQHITAIHLNRVCRNLVGKTAMQVVYDYFLTEARGYLTHTDFTVAEIAYQLNFGDAAYFSRLFKKYVGLSPKAFRRNGVAGPDN